MDYPTLHELIHNTNVEDILQACEELDFKNEREIYAETLTKIMTLSPAPAKEEPFHTILITPWPNTDDKICDLSGLVDGSDKHFAIEFSPWTEWLAARVRVLNVDLTAAQMVAQCLYEMTFISFDEEEISEQKDDLVDRVEEIKSKLGDEN
jgi:hypothetical protein